LGHGTNPLAREARRRGWRVNGGIDEAAGDQR
jgi:hypothetical protein